MDENTDSASRGKALFARLESGDLAGGRPAGYEAELAVHRLNEAPGVRAIRHVFVRGAERREVSPGDPGAEHVGEFDHRRWPANVLASLAAVAAARGESRVCGVACFDESPRPNDWWIRVAEFATDFAAPGHEDERWIGAEDASWCATIDEYGVLRVFGDRAFVDAFAERYGAPLP